ncbi:MAG: stage V sporulation protein T [Oscillospiraceae bacterium]|nr:stage V sporulation protein T [Oscillospiraceae bacterium]
MKATGIVRRIDDLGRVVIPKEIRRTMRIREGDPLEIFTDNDGEVIFKKYSPIGELSNFATQYADVLYKTGGLAVVVCDRDHVVAVSGIPKKELLERRVSPQLEELMEQRKTFVFNASNPSSKLQPVEGVDRYALVAAPIVSVGDVSGVVMYLAGDATTSATDVEVKLVQTAAAFLGKQMEE